MTDKDERIHPLLLHHIYVTGEEPLEWVPVVDIYTQEFKEVIDLIASANFLGLGWAATGYYCPTGPPSDPDAKHVREYHITVYKELLSETLPWTMQQEQKPTE